jgi:heavy metal sensor kinase
MRIPIRTRLAVVYCSIFCVSTVALEAGAYLGLQSAINAVVDRELKSRLHGVEEFLEEHVSRKTMARVQAELASHAALQPERLVIDDARGQRVFPPGALAPFAAVPGADWPVVIRSSNANTPLRILSTRRRIRGQEFALHLGTDLAVPFEILDRFRWILIFSAPIVLIGASAAGYRVSKAALRPVSELTVAAQSITTTNLGRRVRTPASGDEIQSLAETINDMLDRIEDGYRRMAQFTANASHELRTPIALMRATSEVALLVASPTLETYREALHRILAETEKSTELLDNLLQLARADSVARVLKLEPIEIGSAIAAVCEDVAPLAHEKQLDFERVHPGFQIWIAAEANHLRRLCVILLDNAIKYTPEGGTVRVSWKMASPESVVCEIQDSGIGIAETDIPHIFERFYRAGKTRGRDASGAGLGLAIAHWIVDAHRGTIQVESAVGRGSTFRVLLPVLTHHPHQVSLAARRSMDAVNPAEMVKHKMVKQ